MYIVVLTTDSKCGSGRFVGLAPVHLCSALQASTLLQTLRYLKHFITITNLMQTYKLNVNKVESTTRITVISRSQTRHCM